MSPKMASNTEELLFENIKPFPPVINGRINIVKFLEASDGLVLLVERLGAVFSPVKYDMQGNIDKIKRLYKYDDNSCLIELLLDGNSNGKTSATEAVLWLNRALLFFEKIFLEIINQLATGVYDVTMNKILSVAYEGSVKKYHNWVTQQIFTLICRMSPTLPQIIRCFTVDSDIQAFGIKLANYNISLHLIRCKIEDFFKDHNLLNEAT